MGHATCTCDSLWLPPLPGEDRGCVTCTCPASPLGFLTYLGTLPPIPVTLPGFLPYLGHIGAVSPVPAPCLSVTHSLSWGRQGPEAALHLEPHMQISGLLGAWRPSWGTPLREERVAPWLQT